MEKNPAETDGPASIEDDPEMDNEKKKQETENRDAEPKRRNLGGGMTASEDGVTFYLGGGVKFSFSQKSRGLDIDKKKSSRKRLGLDKKRPPVKKERQPRPAIEPKLSKIKELRQAGKTDEEIGKQFGCTKQAIHELRKRFKIFVKRPLRQATPGET